MDKNVIVVAGRSFGKADPLGAQMLRNAGLILEYLPGKASGHDELADRMKGEDVVGVIASTTPITAAMIAAAPSLKVIAMHGVALNHIDVQAANERGILVRAVPGGNAEAVADFTWGLLLALSRRIVEADRSVRDGKWVSLDGYDVFGKTLGILGFGAIGQAVARRAEGFRMTVLSCDPPGQRYEQGKWAQRRDCLERMLPAVDILTIHLPLVEETRGLIAARELALMKPSAYLINVSRGAIVNERDLCRALEERMLAGAAVDVFGKEPPEQDHCLRQAPNCILTPHIASHSREAQRFVGVETAKTILEGLSLLASS